MDQYPEELLKPLIPFVSLIYMEQHHNEMMRILKQSSPTQLKVSSFISEEKLTKKKKKNFEGYKPQGIFKREWFYKHQNIVPSLCMLLCEWKVDEDWKNQELLIIGLVEKVRFALQGRSTKIMVFLLVKKDPVDKEDMKVEEFLANLRKFTQLDQKSIYILDERDLNQSMTSKITKSIVELSNNYYKDVLARIKKTKSEISKQPILLIRHKIKAAFINEIVGQSSKVQKSLQAAYDQLLDLKDEKITLNEVKTVMDYLNFKICQSKLADKKTDVAIKQFLSHINWYRKGETDLMFQHWALIYRQYKTFGEMIEKVVDVSQSQQGSYYIPGYYFQCSANAARMRKKHFQSTCPQHKDLINATINDVSKLSNDDEYKLKTGYIGQQSKGTYSVPYLREIALELNVQHSEDIIKMLTKAYDHYYKRNQKRMIYYIASFIAEEHYFCQRWEKAKKFFERISNHYKKDGWYYPLTNILKYSLECCKQMNQPEQYLNHAIELISDKNSNTLEERKEILSNILKYLEKPFMAPLLQPIIFPMDQTHALLTMKCQFEAPFIPVYQETSFRLKFNYRGPEPLQFSKLMIYFNYEKYNIINDNGIKLLPNQDNIITFPMLIKEKIDLECITITLQLGTSPMAIIFKWQMIENKYYLSLLTNYDHRNEIGNGLFFDRPVIRAIAPKPNLSLTYQHTPPISIDEYYPLTINIHSNDDHITSGKITPIVNDRLIKFYDSSYQLINESFRFHEITPKNTLKLLVFIKTKQLEGTQIYIQFHVEYDSKNYSGLVVDQNLEIRWLFPFNTIFTIEGTRNLKESNYYLNSISSKSYTYKIHKDTNELMNIELRDEKRKELEIFSSQDPIILTTKLTNVSPHQTYLKSIEYKSDNFKLLSPSKVEIMKSLNNLDLFNFIHVILPLKENQNLSLGTLFIEFERGDNNITAKNEMQIPLPSIKISDNKFSCSLDIPKEGKLGQSMIVTLLIQNNSHLLQDLSVNVGDTDHFFYSGTNSINFQILPFSKRKFQYNLIPIQVGHIILPKFNVTNKSNLLLSGNEDWSIFINP